MVVNGTWEGVGPYKCSFSPQSKPVSVMAASEPPFYTVFRLIKHEKKEKNKVYNFKRN